MNKGSFILFWWFECVWPAPFLILSAIWNKNASGQMHCQKHTTTLFSLPVQSFGLHYQLQSNSASHQHSSLLKNVENQALRSWWASSCSAPRERSLFPPDHIGDESAVASSWDTAKACCLCIAGWVHHPFRPYTVGRPSAPSRRIGRQAETSQALGSRASGSSLLVWLWSGGCAGGILQYSKHGQVCVPSLLLWWSSWSVKILKYCNVPLKQLRKLQLV